MYYVSIHNLALSVAIMGDAKISGLVKIGNKYLHH